MARKRVPSWLRAPRICSLELDQLNLADEELDVAQAVAKAAESNASVFRISALSSGGMAYFKSRTAPRAPGLGKRDLVAEAQAACGANELSLMVHVDASGIGLDHPLSPEGARKTGPGGHVEFGDPPAYETCLNGTYRDFLVRLIGELFSTFQPVGCTLRNVRVSHCLCATCVAKYSRETEAEIPETVSDVNDSKVSRYFEWLAKETHELRMDIQRQVKGYQPEAAVFFDDFPTNPSAAREYDGLWLSGEEESLEGRPIWTAREICEYSVPFPGPVLSQVYYGIGGGTNPHTAARPSAELKTVMAQILAGGCYPDLANFPLRDFRGLPGVAEIFGLVKRAAGAFDYRACDPVRYLLLPQQRAWGFSEIELARLATVEASPGADPDGAGVMGLKAQENGSAMYAALLRAGIPVNIGHSAKFLSQLPGQIVLCLANEWLMNDRTVEAVKSFVKAGGGLIATFESSLYDGDRKRRENFGLAEVFGVDYVETRPGSTQPGGAPICLGGSEPHPVVGPLPSGVVLPNREAFAACRSHESATPLAVMSDGNTCCEGPEAAPPGTEGDDRLPAVIAHTYGKGRVVYFPWQPELAYSRFGYRDARLLIREAVYWVSHDNIPVEIQSDGLVAISLFQQRTRYVAHLVNLSADLSQSVDHVFPLKNVSISLNFARKAKVKNQRALVSGVQFKDEVEADTLNIVIPELREYEVIMVEFE